MIIMVRADDRLIHGMVAVSWTSHLQPQTILVANNVAAKDSFKAMTMKMAKPAGVNQKGGRNLHSNVTPGVYDGGGIPVCQKDGRQRGGDFCTDYSDQGTDGI